MRRVPLQMPHEISLSAEFKSLTRVLFPLNMSHEQEKLLKMFFVLFFFFVFLSRQN